VAFAANVSLVAAQEEETAVTVGTAVGEEKEIAVPIQIVRGNDVGAFQFLLKFDGAVLRATRVESGPYLASSGREVFCPEPTIDTDALRISCVTLGSEPLEGAAGDGVLAIVHFDIVGDGETYLTLDQVKLSSPIGNQLFLGTTTDGSFRTAGSQSDGAWETWYIVVIAMAVAIVIAVAGYAGYSRARSRSREAISYPESDPR
jgi:hypothetical protein